MSTIFWEISKRNIRIHMLRSSLAMLGIIIGVVAIASMGILGNSMVQVVSASLSSVGDSVIVTPYAGGGSHFGGGGGGSRVAVQGSRGGDTVLRSGGNQPQGGGRPEGCRL